jgi:hypothetical protein
LLNVLQYLSLVTSLLESESRRRKTVATINSGTDTNNSSVDSARNTVVKLDVQLRDSILLIDRSFLKITDSSSFYHVTDSETLDGLILGNTTVTVNTTNNLVVATTVLVTSVISSFTGLYFIYNTVNNSVLKLNKLLQVFAIEN